MLFKFTITRMTDYEVEAQYYEDAVAVALGAKGLRAQSAAVVDENTVDIEFVAEDEPERDYDDPDYEDKLAERFGTCPDCGCAYGAADWKPCGLSG